MRAFSCANERTVSGIQQSNHGMIDGGREPHRLRDPEARPATIPAEARSGASVARRIRANGVVNPNPWTADYGLDQGHQRHPGQSTVRRSAHSKGE